MQTLFLYGMGGVKQYVDKLVRLLKTFSEESIMKNNWEKSYMYWFDKYTLKP